MISALWGSCAPAKVDAMPLEHGNESHPKSIPSLPVDHEMENARPMAKADLHLHAR